MKSSGFKHLHELSFDDSFIDQLPADPETRNFRRQVSNACYSFVEPTAVSAPELLAHSPDMLNALDLDPGVTEQNDFTDLLTGNQVLDGMRPYAMCYGGHQFGQWAGQLGDGRAIILGDVINHQGQRWSLQLKGAGPTPYSRQADGLAVLRSSLREFVCSEAMYFLGIPTTRALSLALTGEQVVRDMFYNGNPEAEPGAVVCRVAPTFLRFGNFQILAAQGDHQSLRQLADYCIRNYFPDLGEPSVEVYTRWFDVICSLTAQMIVHWQRCGFVHGVMNTDNMSILGLTIDYGPYGWLDTYEPDWTPNTTDANGRRYRYAHQPYIAQWNLLQLAEAIYPLIGDAKPLEAALTRYRDEYEQGWRDASAAKLGFTTGSADSEVLHQGLEAILTEVETDMTLFYRSLAEIEFDAGVTPDVSQLCQLFETCWYQSQQENLPYLDRLAAWTRQYGELVHGQGIDDVERRQRMNSVNPKFVFRNYLAQQAIDKVQDGDTTMLHDLMEVLRTPYDEQPGKDAYAQKRPEWARDRAGCSMLSCSS